MHMRGHVFKCALRLLAAELLAQRLVTLYWAAVVQVALLCGLRFGFTVQVAQRKQALMVPIFRFRIELEDLIRSLQRPLGIATQPAHTCQQHQHVSVFGDQLSGALDGGAGLGPVIGAVVRLRGQPQCRRMIRASLQRLGGMQQHVFHAA